MGMNLLGDVRYCIKIDYFMWNCETDRAYTEETYLTIDTETKDKHGNPMNLLTWETEITPSLRVFDTEDEAKEYMKTHINNPYYGENQRVVKIRFDFEKKEWEEC